MSSFNDNKDSRLDLGSQDLYVKSHLYPNIRWYKGLSAIGNLFLNLGGEAVLPATLHRVKTETVLVEERSEWATRDFPAAYLNGPHASKRLASAQRTQKLLTTNFVNVLLAQENDTLDLRHKSEWAVRLLASGDLREGRHGVEEVMLQRQATLARLGDALAEHIEKELDTVTKTGTFGTDSTLHHLYKKTLFELAIEKRLRAQMREHKLLKENNEMLRDYVKIFRKQTLKDPLKDLQKVAIRQLAEGEAGVKHKQYTEDHYDLADGIKVLDEQYKIGAEMLVRRLKEVGDLRFKIAHISKDKKVYEQSYKVLLSLFIFLLGKMGHADFQILEEVPTEEDPTENEKEKLKREKEKCQKVLLRNKFELAGSSAKTPAALHEAFEKRIQEALKSHSVFDFDDIIRICIEHLLIDIGPYLKVADGNFDQLAFAQQIESILGQDRRVVSRMQSELTESLNLNSLVGLTQSEQPDSLNVNSPKRSYIKTLEAVKNFLGQSENFPLRKHQTKPVVPEKAPQYTLEKAHEMAEAPKEKSGVTIDFSKLKNEDAVVVGTVKNYAHAFIDVKGNGKDEDIMRFYPHLTLMGNFVLNLLGPSYLPEYCRDMASLPEHIRKQYGEDYQYPKGYLHRASHKSGERSRSCQAMADYIDEKLGSIPGDPEVAKALLFVADPYQTGSDELSGSDDRTEKLEQVSANIMHKLKREARNITPSGFFGANSFLYHLYKKVMFEGICEKRRKDIFRDCVRMRAENAIMKDYVYFRVNENKYFELMHRHAQEGVHLKEEQLRFEKQYALNIDSVKNPLVLLVNMIVRCFQALIRTPKVSEDQKGDLEEYQQKVEDLSFNIGSSAESPIRRKLRIQRERAKRFNREVEVERQLTPERQKERRTEQARKRTLQKLPHYPRTILEGLYNAKDELGSRELVDDKKERLLSELKKEDLKRNRGKRRYGRVGPNIIDASPRYMAVALKCFNLIVEYPEDNEAFAKDVLDTFIKHEEHLCIETLLPKFRDLWKGKQLDDWKREYADQILKRLRQHGDQKRLNALMPDFKDLWKTKAKQTSRPGAPRRHSMPASSVPASFQPVLTPQPRRRGASGLRHPQVRRPVQTQTSDTQPNR